LVVEVVVTVSVAEVVAVAVTVLVTVFPPPHPEIMETVAINSISRTRSSFFIISSLFYWLAIMPRTI
jgi:hypothetical protein